MADDHLYVHQGGRPIGSLLHRRCDLCWLIISQEACWGHAQITGNTPDGRA